MVEIDLKTLGDENCRRETVQDRDIGDEVCI
jgi:hypothetical protein